MTRGMYPYAYFSKSKISSKPIDFSIEFSPYYHSLSYLNIQSAQKLHSGKRSITQDLIIGLVHLNEMMKGATLATPLLSELAEGLIQKSVLTEEKMTFFFDEAYARFDLEGSYSSGIVQGKAASFFLRYYALSKDDKYLGLAKKCLVAALQPIGENGALRTLENDMLWVEEYPSPKPSMVLNGFLFYIIGLLEYLSFEDDEELKAQLDICMQSVIAWLPNYKVIGGLLYSMYRWNLCNVHYTAVMKYQFEHLYQLTNLAIFKEYAEYTDDLTNWKVFKKAILSS